MEKPDQLLTELKKVYNSKVEIATVVNINGGCINNTSVVELNSGEKIFVKENSSGDYNMFQAEAKGLMALKSEKGPIVPEVIQHFSAGQSEFLLLQYIEPGIKSEKFWEKAGIGLARLHKEKKSENYGFSDDNYIGSSPQINQKENNWVKFFGEKRLLFLAKLALKRRNNSQIIKRVENLLLKLNGIINSSPSPSLVHGDLWEGNLMADKNHRPVLIDPAVYYGDRETDLAMTELFGGFSPIFYDAYNSIYPLEPEYKERRDIYNLYHLINHYNIFGDSYLSSIESIINRYV